MYFPRHRQRTRRGPAELRSVYNYTSTMTPP
jgi:hypothetical protein